MAPQYDDDEWSDSDEEEGSDIETSVQLGIPDGPLDSASDRLDAAVSRIGGHPVRYHSLIRACTLILIQCNYFSVHTSFITTRTLLSSAHFFPSVHLLGPIANTVLIGILNEP